MAWIVQQDGTSFIVQQDGTSRLLLNDVAAVTPQAGRLRPSLPPDSGQVELRGVIRAGLVIAAAVTFAGTVRPAPLPTVDQLPGRITTGVVVAPPAAAPPYAPTIHPATLDEPASLSGRVTTGLVVTAPTAPTYVPTVRPAALSDLPDTRGRITTGLVVAPPAAFRLTSPPGPEPAPLTGTVRTGLSVTPASAPWAAPVVRPVTLLEHVALVGVVRTGYVVAGPLVPPSASGTGAAELAAVATTATVKRAAGAAELLLGQQAAVHPTSAQAELLTVTASAHKFDSLNDDNTLTGPAGTTRLSTAQSSATLATPPPIGDTP